MEYSNIAIIVILLLSIIFLVIFGAGSKASNEHEIDCKINNQSPNQLLSEFKRQSQTLKLCTFGGGLLTFMFVVAFFVGGDMNPMHWGIEQWFAVLAGAFVVFSITAVQYNLYQDTNGNKVGMAITIGILCFVYYSEIASTAEREAELVRNRSADSPTLQVTLDAIKTSSSISNISINVKEIARTTRLITHHKNELRYCAEKHASRGAKRIQRCERWERNKVAEYQAVLNSYKKADSNNATALINNTSNLINQAKSLEYNEDQHAAIVKFFQQTFDVSFSAAMMFAAFILVNAFELGFHYSGSQVGQLRTALARIGYDIETNTTDYEIESARLELVKMQHAVGTKREMAKLQNKMKRIKTAPAPKQVQQVQQVQEQPHPKRSAPKQVQQVQEQVTPKRSAPKQVQQLRKTITADTGIKAPHNTRYLALVEAIKNGNCSGSFRAIKQFKFGGRGMGSSTAQFYQHALKNDGVI